MARLRLRLNNPYSIGQVTQFSDDTAELKRPRVAFVATENDKYHTVKQWDDLWSLSFEYYGDSKFWWLIRDVNNLFDPFVLTINESLIIPDLDTIKATAL